LTKKDEKKKEEQPKKKKKKKSNYYFTLDTQNKIVEYQKLKNKRRQDSIYTEHIQPAFTELVHNLVSVYKFKSSIEDINHLKHDCVVFLFETIYKWKPENGTKAFSYFNVVAKNWLTIHSRRLLKHSRRSVSVDNPTDFTSYEKSQLNRIDKDVAQAYEDDIKRDSFTEVFNGILQQVKLKLKDQRDFRCIEAIQQVFDNVENLDYLNKRAVFVYLREISGLNSTELSSSLSNIRKHYRKIVGTDIDFI
tara:strand:- start:474 stop:1220 length:747 start_codon:yes stop_codon:yes gene_type:complete